VLIQQPYAPSRARELMRDTRAKNSRANDRDVVRFSHRH